MKKKTLPANFNYTIKIESVDGPRRFKRTTRGGEKRRNQNERPNTNNIMWTNDNPTNPTTSESYLDRTHTSILLRSRSLLIKALPALTQ